MSIIVADEGVEAMLNIMFNNVWPTSKDLTLKLYCNDKTPVDTDAATDYTEAAGGGYTAKTLTNGSWVLSTVIGIVQAAYAQQVFTFTGELTTNLTVYGYYIVDDDGVLQWAERFDTAATPYINGNHIDVTPIFQGSKGSVS